MNRSYTYDDLMSAVSAVKDDGISVRQASRTYKVPFNTLRRRAHGTVDIDCMRPGPVPFLGFVVEKEIREAIVEFQKMGHGLSRREIIQLAGDVESKNDMKVFKNSLPSRRWYDSFMKRHNLALRQSERSSAGGSYMASADTTKAEFFTKLGNVINDLKVTGIDIYNVGETGFTTVYKNGKVVQKESKTVAMRKNAAGSSENITVVAACNAIASVILPPMIIFKGEELNDELKVGAPENTIFAISPKGYIDSEIFYTWFVKFIAMIPSRRPVLLLLEEHASHVKRKTLILAKENDIHFLVFPPHICQPLDVGVFGPLREAFSDACNKLMKETVNRHDFCKVLSSAWQNAVVPANILCGFRGSGIWPLNPDAVYSDRIAKSNSVIAATSSDDIGSLECSVNVIVMPNVENSPVVKMFTPQDSRGVVIPEEKDRSKPKPKRRRIQTSKNAEEENKSE